MIEPGKIVPHVDRYGILRSGPSSHPLVLDQGRSYLILGERSDKAMTMVAELMRTGAHLLCASRAHPDLIADHWRGMMPEYLWLSEREGNGNVAPDQLSRLARRIEEHLRSHQNPAVYLDGLEYLALFNDFQRLQMFMEHLNDLLMDTGGIMLVSVDPRLFDPRSLARLRRFAEVVE